jgi:hypothetical protein
MGNRRLAERKPYPTQNKLKIEPCLVGPANVSLSHLTIVLNYIMAITVRTGIWTEKIGKCLQNVLWSVRLAQEARVFGKFFFGRGVEPRRNKKMNWGPSVPYGVGQPQSVQRSRHSDIGENRSNVVPALQYLNCTSASRLPGRYIQRLPATLPSPPGCSPRLRRLRVWAAGADPSPEGAAALASRWVGTPSLLRSSCAKSDRQVAENSLKSMKPLRSSRIAAWLPHRRRESLYR